MIDAPTRRQVLALAAGAALGPSTPCAARANPGARARTPLVIEDFEWYRTDTEVAKIWYRPPHGAWLRQSLDTGIKHSGRQSLRVEYRIAREKGQDYSAFCRVSRWDLTGYGGLRFWLKPAGPARRLEVQLNIANRQGKNIHDLWETAYVAPGVDETPRLVTVPFATLKHNTKYADSPDVSPAFRPEAVIEIAFYVHGDGAEGTGAFHFDQLEAV